jgi:hypothetical protein
MQIDVVLIYPDGTIGERMSLQIQSYIISIYHKNACLLNKCPPFL